jgi:hypothetical protein
MFRHCAEYYRVPQEWRLKVAWLTEQTMRARRIYKDDPTLGNIAVSWVEA